MANVCGHTVLLILSRHANAIGPPALVYSGYRMADVRSIYMVFIYNIRFSKQILLRQYSSVLG
jgi:hypothetical protein